MRGRLVKHQNGEIVAYQNSQDGRIVTKDMYSNVVKREIIQEWEENYNNCKNEFKTLSDYMNHRLISKETDYIPLQYI